MSFMDDLAKILGNRRPRYERVPNRQRLTGDTGESRTPWGGDKPENDCVDKYAMLQFDADGQPSIFSARVVEGLFEVTTGRQVRIFLDADAVICDDVSPLSEYIWYKLQIKEKLTTRQKIMLGDLDTPLLQGNTWKTYLDVYGIFTMPDNPATGFLDSNLKQLNILNRTASNAPVFFSTVPLKQQLIDEDKDKYKKAVTEIADYFNNNIDGYTGKYVEQRLTKHKTNTCIMDTAYVWPPQMVNTLNDFSSYLNLNLSQKQDGFCKWVSNAENLFYTTGDKFNYTGGRWYWGMNPPDSKDYDSRWRFADDLTYWASYLLARRNLKMQQSGTLQPLDEWYINSYDDAQKGTQFADMAVSLYYRPRYKDDGSPTTEADYILQGTIKPEGNKYLWGVNIWPDDAIINLHFNVNIGRFIAAHPTSAELMPDKLNDLTELTLQDDKDNKYSIRPVKGGFLLTSTAANKTWMVGFADYALAENS